MLIAGPILRRVDAKSVNIWLACGDENPPLNAILKDDSTDLVGTSKDLTFQIGNKLYIKLLTFTPSVALQAGKIYSYDIHKADNSSILQKLIDDPITPLGYDKGKLPTFVLPANEVKNLVVAHGSCRKMHGDGQEALSILDEVLKGTVTDSGKRIQQLFMTGDQLYADEIPRFGLWSITESARKFINAKEDLPLPEKLVEGDSEPYPAKRILPADALPGLRAQLLTQYARMTTSSGESHLLTFGEFCMGYLHAWSPDAWEKPFLDAAIAMKDFPNTETVTNNWKSFQEKTNFTTVSIVDKEYLPFFLDEDEKAKNELAEHRKSIRNESDEEKRHDLTDFFVTTKFKKEEESFYEAHKRALAYELREVADFLETLPKVRRVMANTPTYMIFDDHEITDDWNISMEWKNLVYSNVLGKTVIRNGLMAYALCQDLGNNPEDYSKMPEESKKADLVGHIKTYAALSDFSAASATTDLIDNLLGINTPDAKSEIKWHYLIESGPNVKTLFLDTRTRRSLKTLRSRPGLLDKQAFEEQFKFSSTPKTDDMLFVISACPAIGLSVFEELVYPVASSVKGQFSEKADGTHVGFINGQLAFDNEAWYLDSEAFEELLKRMGSFKKVVLFSGDIHYGFTTFMDYWKKDETQPSRYIQLVSSPLKNLWQKNIRLFQSGFVQGVFSGFGGKLEKFGWEHSPSVSTTNLSVVNRRRLREQPAVIDNSGLRGEVTISPVPDWRYRLQVAVDLSNQLQFSEPFDKTKTAHLKAIAQRFHDDYKLAKSRRLMFANHVCTVSFEGDKLHHTFRFKAPDGIQHLQMVHEVPLSPVTEADKKMPELVPATTSS